MLPVHHHTRLIGLKYAPRDGSISTDSGLSILLSADCAALFEEAA